MSIIDEELAKAFLDAPCDARPGQRPTNLWSREVADCSEITDGAAEVLSKHEGWLELSGLTELSDAAAESLSKHRGALCLDGLTELSDAAAEALSKAQGCLALNGLTELSDTAAESDLAGGIDWRGAMLSVHGSVLKTSNATPASFPDSRPSARASSS